MRGVSILSSAISSPAKAGTILAISSFLAMTLGGCSEAGPKLGLVSGIVTFEGQPVPSAYVVFEPIDPPGAYGAAYTREDGQYELRYSRSRDGALVGRHQVTITTTSNEESEAEKPARRTVTPKGQRARPNGSFEREVKPGKNVHDFDLTDQGRASSR